MILEVIYVLGTRKFSLTNILYSPRRNCEGMKDTEMISQVQSTKVVSRDILSVAFAANDSMEMTSFMLIAEISTSDVTSVIVALLTGSNSIMLIMMLSKTIFKKITSCALIQSVWRRSSWFLNLKWI